MLYELIYRSQAKAGIREEDLKNILETARSFNASENITGCLLFHDNQFLQLLEGEFNVLMELYERIKLDQRHSNVVLLHMRETAYRIYTDWTMAFKSVDSQTLQDNTGVTEFTALETADNESALSKQLFQVVSKDIVSG